MKRLYALLASFMLLCSVSVVSAAAPDVSAMPEEFVVRAYYRNIEDISRLVDYDVWEYNNLKEHYVLVAVSHAQYAELVKAGWRLEIDSDASAQIDPERLRGILDAYRNVDAIYADLDNIGATHPSI